MISRHSQSLLNLQRALQDRANDQGSGEGDTYVVFEAAGQTLAISSKHVQRVLMPGAMITLKGYTQLPECVLGTIADEDQMLSVVDACHLLSGQPAVTTIKSRLVVFSEGELKGVALQVDRIQDRREEGALPEQVRVVDAEAIYALLNTKIKQGD